MEDKNQESRIQKRIDYFKTKIEEYFGQYKLKFSEFVPNQEILDFGNKLLVRGCSGFNFATDEQFPVKSGIPLIFYGIYAQRTRHLGILLAKMEDEHIIDELDVSFGIKEQK